MLIVVADFREATRLLQNSFVPLKTLVLSAQSPVLSVLNLLGDHLSVQEFLKSALGRTRTCDPRPRSPQRRARDGNSGTSEGTDMIWEEPIAVGLDRCKVRLRPGFSRRAR